MNDEYTKYVEKLIVDIFNHFDVYLPNDMFEMLRKTFWHSIVFDHELHDRGEHGKVSERTNEYIQNTLLIGYRHYNKYANIDQSFAELIERSLIQRMQEDYKDLDMRTSVRLDTGEIVNVPVGDMAGEIVRAGGFEKDDINIKDILLKYGDTYMQINNKVYNRDLIGKEVVEYVKSRNCPNEIYDLLQGTRELNGMKLYDKAREHNRLVTMLTSIKNIVESSGRMGMILGILKGGTDDYDIFKEIVYRSAEYTKTDGGDKSKDFGFEYIGIIQRLGIQVYSMDAETHLYEGMSKSEALALSYMEYMYYFSGLNRKYIDRRVSSICDGHYSHRGELIFMSDIDVGKCIKNYIVAVLDNTVIDKKVLAYVKKYIRTNLDN